MRSFTLGAALLATLTEGAALKKKFSSPADPARFKFYDTPTKGVICDGDTGPDGLTMWYEDFAAPRVGRFNYQTEKFDEWTIPYSKGVHNTAPFVGNVTGLQCVVRSGLDGYIYVGSGIRNEVVRVNPWTDPPNFQLYGNPVPNAAGNLQPFNDAWGAHKGMYFSQTTGGVVSLFDYKTLEFTNFAEGITPGSGPLGMRTDKEQNLWFTNFQGQYMSKLDNLTGSITEYKDCCPLPQASFPEVLRSSTQNQKYLWANAFGGGGYIRIEPAQTNPDKIFNVYTNPKGAGTFPFENTNDFCGRIWYTSPVFDELNYYTPSTGQWTTIPVPDFGGLPVAGNFEVIMHRGPGHYMWFSIGTLGKLVRYELDASCAGSTE